MNARLGLAVRLAKENVAAAKTVRLSGRRDRGRTRLIYRQQLRRYDAGGRTYS